MKRLIFSAITIGAILFCATSFAVDFRRAKTFQDCYEASCRVCVSNARGTGTFIGYDAEKDRCLILTNYHVVTNNNSARLDFWTNGTLQSVNGKVFARFYNAQIPYDFALISVDPEELEKIAPPYIALAGKDAAPDSKSFIISSGAPKGRHVQAWKGQVLGYFNGATVEFRPAPVPGQSGSAIVSEVDGQLWITGVLTWLIGAEGADESKGGAIPISNLYRALNGRTDASSGSESPIPPDATECVEKKSYCVEISQDNCKPCEDAEKDVAQIKKSGFNIVSYNASNKEGARRAIELGVKSTPTFIVYDGTGTETARFEGAGHGAEIVAALKLSEKPTAPKIQKQAAKEPPKPTTTDEEADYLQEDLRLYEQDLFTLPELDNSPELVTANDFRKRAPVYENADDYENAGFFDDSDACWRQRRSQREQELTPKEQTPNPQTPAPPTIDEGKLGDRLGNRLRNGLSDSLGAQIEGAIDSIEKRVEKKADSKIAEVKADIRKTFDKWKWRIFFAFIAVIILANLCAGLIINAFKGLYHWLLCDDLDDTEDELISQDTTNNVGYERKGTAQNDRLRRTKTKT